MLADFFTKLLQGSLFIRLQNVIMGTTHIDTLLQHVPKPTVPDTTKEHVEESKNDSMCNGGDNGISNVVIPKHNNYDNNKTEQIVVPGMEAYRSVHAASLLKDIHTAPEPTNTDTVQIKQLPLPTTKPSCDGTTRTYAEALLAKTQQCFVRRSTAKSEISKSHSLQILPSLESKSKS